MASVVSMTEEAEEEAEEEADEALSCDNELPPEQEAKDDSITAASARRTQESCRIPRTTTKLCGILRNRCLRVLFDNSIIIYIVLFFMYVCQRQQKKRSPNTEPRYSIQNQFRMRERTDSRVVFKTIENSSQIIFSASLRKRSSDM